MKIAQLAPLTESVPPRLYGGTERVVSWLTDELVRRGHEVTLFASGDSRSGARLRAMVPVALRLAASPQDPLVVHLVELAEACDAEVDVIHSHVGYLAFPFARFAHAPVLHTMHGRLDLPHTDEMFSHFPGAALISISDAQRKPVSHLDINWLGTVYHGLPVREVPVHGSGAGGYLAFLGRICPEKRPDLAIAVAKHLGLRLLIAAKVDAQDRSYFERDIRPLLNDPCIEFIGELDETQKLAFLRDALCLLFPIDWPEPFGLVMIEAMACGTPVVARPCGSVAEVIIDGVTGYIAETVEGMASAVRRIDRIDRSRCRQHVEDNFSVRTMTDRYERLYEGLVRR